jgi:Protein of unknown function (DUF1566)
MRNFITLAFLGFTSMVASATCPSWPTAERFTYSADGAEVTDQRTGLVWARCSVGQAWSGSDCANTASGFTHEGALQYAATQAGWRLPSRRELSSLADKGCIAPAIDSTAFPTTFASVYWSASPWVSSSAGAWGVEFFSGRLYGFARFNLGGYIRLVRSSP